MPAVTVTPEEARALIARQMPLIDIRGTDEWRREHIAGARTLPLEHIAHGMSDDSALRAADTVVFHCQSGMRTGNAAEQLSAAVYPAKAVLMQGGLNAWKAAGYPVEADRRQPLPLMRQVQMTAGALALGGTLAGAFLTPAFYCIPGIVGTGLIVAGITGWCGMAKLLAVMPWNQARK
ncbi:Rhodanese-related sulfurtransferases [Cronobacter condimenti 1330]|uniref:Rhodanese-related sulfurtransferases n=1 Tax=Cronobacter condimenti 1330 TaxID=1073999 RepID=K8A088_9ENTR|nr:rhodanese family protein [Cronobacter condimenti]ALB63202.1 hypothetical protein AFK62_12110 [Cronobacter condimenti 1330]CCJ72115.1 Rhodanese-related sulfurtransferases [Cronobacter condimenti 1330]